MIIIAVELRILMTRMSGRCREEAQRSSRRLCETVMFMNDMCDDMNMMDNGDDDNDDDNDDLNDMDDKMDLQRTQ